MEAKARWKPGLGCFVWWGCVGGWSEKGVGLPGVCGGVMGCGRAGVGGWGGRSNGCLRCNEDAGVPARCTPIDRGYN